MAAPSKSNDSIVLAILIAVNCAAIWMAAANYSHERRELNMRYQRRMAAEVCAAYLFSLSDEELAAVKFDMEVLKYAFK